MESSFVKGTLLILILFEVRTNAGQLKEVQLLNDVFDAVERELKFFADDYSAINVDGLFGLRLGQGQLKEAKRECSLKKCDKQLFDKLQTLEKDLDETCNMALPYLNQEDPAYFERFVATVDSPYTMPYKATHFVGKQTKIGDNTQYDEEQGDICYARLLGTYTENDKYLPRCNLTQDCWNYMTQDDTSGYFITHQLLYFIFIEHVGCREAVESFVDGQLVRDIQEQLCHKIYDEARQLSQFGDVVQIKKDLFLEQSVLCGPLGFEDFMKSDWIKMVLEWPDKRLGCFRYNAYKLLQDMFKIKPEIKSLPGTSNTGDEEVRQHTNSEDGSTMRKLLREKGMKDGCLSHTSGLGFGILCTYLRYLVRYI